MIVKVLHVQEEWNEKDASDLLIGDVFAHPGSPVAHYVTHVADYRDPDEPTYIRGYELIISEERVAALKKGLEDAHLEGYFDIIVQRCFIGRVIKFKA